MIRTFVFTFLISITFRVSAQVQKDTLLVGYTPASPFIIDENDQLDGISVWLWKHCANELNLTYRLVPMNFREMLDAVKTGDIDVSINPLTITSSRLENMDFTHSFFASHSVLVKGHLSHFGRLKRFFGSFLSFGFLSGFLALIFIIALFGFLEWYFERRVNPQHFRKGWKGMWDGMWWSVVTMTTVGYGDKTPKSRGGKVVALIWMFSGLLFISGLTASVASTLTVDRLIDNSSEVKDFKDKPVGTVAHSSSEHFLKHQFFRDLHLFSSLTNGLDALNLHTIDAFIYDEPIVRYQMLHDSKYANLDVLPHKFNVQFYAFALPKKHRILRDMLSKEIVGITEHSEWQEVLSEFGCGETN